MPDANAPLVARAAFAMHALCVGDRIDTKALELDRLAMRPPVVRVGPGYAVVFRFGAIVLCDVPREEQERFLRELAPLVRDPENTPETEDVEVRVASGDAEGVANGVVSLQHVDVERLQLVADALAKSVVLSRYEAHIGEAFDSVEPLAAALERRARISPRAKNLVRRIGATLLAEHQMVWRVEMAEKPDLLWDRPDLERLHAALQDEYELTERFKVLENKLELLNRTASTLLSLLYNRRALRVEWYIVLLIVVEIGISVYEMTAGSW